MSVPTDIRHAFRLLARSPLFTVTSVLSVAIGIAAATVIFGVADALLLRASPGIRDASRVVDIARTTNGRGFGTMSYPAFQHLREQTQSLEGMAATTLSPVPMSMRASGEAAAVRRASACTARTVSANFFDVLGVRPAMGRFFRGDEDHVADARPVAVLSHRFWRDRFRSDAGVLDRTISLNGVAFTVIGVAEAGFENTTFVGTDLWIPMMMAAAVRAPAEPAAELFGNPRSTWHMAIGRLKPGVTVEAAQAELNTLFDAFKTSVGAGRSGGARHSRRPQRTRAAARAAAVQRVRGSAVRADRGPAGDCVQQRGGHAAGAIGGASPRNGDAPGDRREPRAPDRSDADRNARVVRRGRSRGNSDRAVADRRVAGPSCRRCRCRSRSICR